MSSTLVQHCINVIQMFVFAGLSYPDDIARLWHRDLHFLNVIVKKNRKFTPAKNGQVFIGTWNIRFNFMVSEFG